MPLIRSALPLALIAALAGCGKPATDDVLAFVPADSPYVIANLEAPPESTFRAMADKLAPLSAFYESMITKALTGLEGKQATEDRIARAILEELKGKMSLDGMRSLGFTPSARSAIYGIGLVPVVRIELADAAAFRAAIGRIEKNAGDAMPSAKLGDQDYWILGDGETPVAGLMAVVGEKTLLLSLMPKDASESVLKQLLGITPPETSLLESGAISALNDKEGYTPYGSGWVDLVRLTELLASPKQGLEAEFLKAFGVEQDFTLEGQCRDEALRIVRQMPRILFGYDRFDATGMDTRSLIEIEPVSAKLLSATVAPVPGLGISGKGIVDFGFGVDIGKLNEFATTQAAAVAANPFKCEHFAQLNTYFGEIQNGSANPFVFAADPVFSGFHASLTRFDIKADGSQPDIAGKLLIASDNPASLIAMAGNFLPQVKELGLKPDGEIKSVAVESLPPGTPPMSVMMQPKVLGISVGAGEEAGLAEFASAAPGNPAPLMLIGYGGEFYVRMFEMMETSMQAMEPEQRDQIMGDMSVMRDVYGKFIDRADTSVLLTERGIELRQQLRMK